MGAEARFIGNIIKGLTGGNEEFPMPSLWGQPTKIATAAQFAFKMATGRNDARRYQRVHYNPFEYAPRRPYLATMNWNQPNVLLQTAQSDTFLFGGGGSEQGPDP